MSDIVWISNKETGKELLNIGILKNENLKLALIWVFEVKLIFLRIKREYGVYSMIRTLE